MRLRYKRVLGSFLLLFIISLIVLGANEYRLINLPMLTQDNARAPLIIKLERSTSAYQFVHLLKEHNLIHSTRFFLLIIRAQGQAHQLKAGIYQIKPGESAIELLNRVIAGDVLTQNFAIIAGTTQQKIQQDLIKAPYLNYNQEDWLSIKDNHSNAEGLLLADTYQYRGGSSSKILLEQAHQNLMNYLNQAWQERSPDLPYQNAYELLIAASIIEKESALPEERKLIAGVLVNRLKKKMPLQMDPTVIYGLGNQYTGTLLHNDMQIDSPYNSYRYKGLPPTPIAMVGKEAIAAAAQPQSSNYLYFVATGNGAHQFSVTYEQQRQAIEHNRHKDF